MIRFKFNALVVKEGKAENGKAEQKKSKHSLPIVTY